MRELGQEDATFRNYDILHWTGRSDKSESTHLWLALNRIGGLLASNSRASIPYGVAEAAQRIVNLGGERPSNEKLIIRLVGWYVWDRIRKGELIKWPYLKSK